MSFDIDYLKQLVKCNVCPILVCDLDLSNFKNYICINADCDKLDLVGHFEGDKEVAPNWLSNLTKNNIQLVVIDDLCKISKDEQLKFYELLKYRKVGVFELPKNCAILVNSSKVGKEYINEQIYSLVAKI